MLVACIVHGQVHHMQGRSQAALAWLERGLAAAERWMSAPGISRGPAGHAARAAGHRVVHLGLLSRRAPASRARDRARARDPMTRLVATWDSALVEVRLGNAERVAVLAEEMRRWSTSSRWRRAERPAAGSAVGRTLNGARSRGTA